MKNNTLNRGKRNKKLVNWITVWGFIFACIAYNFYVDGRQTRIERKFYHNQYQAESQRADSLRRAVVKLEQQLQEAESSSAQRISTEYTETPSKASGVRAL